jgi:hypothetical protein
MRASSYGRIVFGGSAVLLGVISLLWHDAETWQTLRQIWSLPLGAAIGACLMICQIAGGIAIQHPRSAHPASVVLGIVYLMFCLACVPGIVAAPAAWVHYGSFFEQFCPLCGALAVYTATETNAARAAAFGRVARLGLGACAVSFTLSQVFYLRLTAGLVPHWIPPNQMFWAVLTTVAFGLAAIAILVNRQARLAIRLMAFMLAVFAVLVWISLLIAHPEAHLNWSEFGLTLLITGATSTVADLRAF